MPTIEVSYDDLQMLIGKHIPLDELRDKAILYTKAEIDEIDGTTLKIDSKDTNRPDLWSAEGIAREIRFRVSPGKLPSYPAGKSGRKIIVSKEMKGIRPLIAAAIIKNIKVTEELLIQMIHLQDKVDETFGRGRKEIAIGIYDYDRVRGDIKYIAADPNKTRFAPLESTKELTLNKILKQHPKGRDYGHLISAYPKFPLLVDSKGDVLSMPPVINSNYSGKVKSTTKNLMIEVTGYRENYVSTAINVMAAALVDRGGELETVEIAYPNRKVTTPNFTPKQISVDIDSIRKVLGIEITDSQAYDLLKRSGYEIASKGRKARLLYPAYRQDIMHWRDVAEDVAITYGYCNVNPTTPRLATIGKEIEIEAFARKAAEIMVGLGTQEIMSYILTNKDSLFGKMNTKDEPSVEIENIISANWSVFRTWLLPGMLEFFSKNKNKEYPQKIFEIGDVIIMDEKAETKTQDIRKLVFALSSNTAGYEDASSMLDALFSGLGLKYSLMPVEHSSFIKGRAASIILSGKETGIIGELHPKALNNWGLEKPVVAFELNLQQIFGTKK